MILISLQEQTEPGKLEFAITNWAKSRTIHPRLMTDIGESIYRVLDGVVENTFGFNPCK